MGILNVTPDSFYDGGKSFNIKEAFQRYKDLVEEGSDIIDVGAVSTRPGALVVPYNEEKKRLIPLLKEIKSSPVPLSIDTSNPLIAQEALDLGATYINDIYGFENKDLRKVVSGYKAKIVVMHMKGNPQTMQLNPHYPQGVIPELIDWFDNRIKLLEEEGILRENIILDPGIGFGKNISDCIMILKNLAAFKIFGLPLLIGLSRKSFMSKIIQKPATELLSTTIALNTMSLLGGAEIIRVHDVKEHRDAINILHACF